MTAFVLKSFQQANSHIDIDNNVIDACIHWLFNRQLSDGSFDEPGEVHHKAMQGGSGQGTASLSAFVLIALMQDKALIKRNYTSQVSKAEKFLLEKLRESQSAYEIALITYALHTVDSPARNSAHQKLINFVKRKDDQAWLLADTTKPDTLTDKQSFHFFLPKSLDIEATSYALLTLVIRNEVDASFPFMRWLISQQNERGGFSSTQDTVIGIQALAQLAERVSSTTVALTTNFVFGGDNSPSGSRQFQVNSGNANVLQRQELSPSSKFVEFEATGFGTAVVQVSWQYNLAVSAEEPAFFINPQIGKSSTENYMQLNVCT